MMSHSLLRWTQNALFRVADQGLMGHPDSPADGTSPLVQMNSGVMRRYSAASASSDFGFADDIMKSEMRGTISDLNREPLNTP